MGNDSSKQKEANPQPSQVNNDINESVFNTFAPQGQANQANAQQNYIQQQNYIPQQQQQYMNQGIYQSAYMAPYEQEPRVQRVNPFKDAKEDPLDTVTTQEKAKTTEGAEVNLEEIIKVSAKAKTKNFKLSSFVDAEIPIMTSLKVKSVKGAEKSAVDLICVIDHSGSMEGTKIDLVRKSFKYLLEYLDDKDRLSIIIFDDKAETLNPLVRMTKENKDKILQLVETIYDDGGTNINLGITQALDVLKERKHINSVSSIFLLSDGLDGGAQTKVKTTLEKYSLKENFTIHTFGFGTDHDPKMMTDIADLKDGNFYYIEKLDTVDECFVDCLGGLISVVAKNVEIKIKGETSELFPKLEITKAYGDASMWEKKDGRFVTKIAQLISGKEKDYILMAKLPKTSAEANDAQRNTKIASVEVSMIGLNDKKFTVTADLIMEIINETEDTQVDTEDKDLLVNYYRVQGAEVLTSAKNLADQRKYEDAQKVLKNFKEELGGCPVKGEQFILNLIKDVEQAINDTKPQEYEARGKHNMIGNARAQYQQKSYMQSANVYSNDIQQEMVFQTKSKKAAFF